MISLLMFLLWAVVLGLTVFVHAAGIPTCAAQCADQAAAAAGCASLLDVACLCASPTFSSSTGRCAFGNCSPDDILLVEAFLTALCQPGFSSQTPSGSLIGPSATSTGTNSAVATSGSDVASNTVTSSAAAAATMTTTTTTSSQLLSATGMTLTVPPGTPHLSTTVVFQSSPLASPSDSDSGLSSGSVPVRVLGGRMVVVVLSTLFLACALRANVF